MRQLGLGMKVPNIILARSRSPSIVGSAIEPEPTLLRLCLAWYLHETMVPRVKVGTGIENVCDTERPI